MPHQNLKNVLLGTLLCSLIGFVSMLLTAIAFTQAWYMPLALLALIWLAYLGLLLLRWRYLGNVWLSAFAGFALGLLREADRFEDHPLGQTLAWLPEAWIGYAGLVFFFVFLAFLPWLASRLAAKVVTRPRHPTEAARVRR